MSTIIGITSGSESGVCIYYNGKIIFAINEERLSRLKNDHSYPKINSIHKKTFFKRIKKYRKDLFRFTTAAIGNKFAKNTLTRLLKYKDIDKNSYQIIIDRLRTEIEIDSAKLRHLREI